MAGGQLCSGDFPSSTHGSLILFARRDERIAVAADSRAVLSTDSHTFKDTCKLRLPKLTTLLGITGQVTLARNDTERWNGLDSANQIFSSGGIESEESIQQKEELWLKDLQDVIAEGGFAPSREDWNGKYWTILSVFTSVSGKIHVFRVGLMASNGRFLPVRPAVDTPADGQTQHELFGMTAALDVSKMNQPERERYQNLMNAQKPKASSVAELRALTLSLEQLGSDVNGRIAATRNEPAEVAGPFSSATLDANQQRWLTYPEGPCLTILPVPPKKTADPHDRQKPSD